MRTAALYHFGKELFSSHNVLTLPVPSFSNFHVVIKWMLFIGKMSLSITLIHSSDHLKDCIIFNDFYSILNLLNKLLREH